MPLGEEQVKSIKAQLFKYIDTLPKEKQGQLRSYIESLDNKQLEEFLIKNKMLQEADAEASEGEGNSEEDNPESSGSTKEGDKSKDSKSKEPQCIYCLISSKKVESFTLYEDKDYLGALEINPLSRGHSILIPKKHIEEAKSLKSKTFTVANKIGRHIIKKLDAENFQVNSSNELGHAIVNIIPIYKGQKLTGDRKPADKKFLQELAIKIGEIKKREVGKRNNSESNGDNKESKKSTFEIKKGTILQLPRRIP